MPGYVNASAQPDAAAPLVVKLGGAALDDAATLEKVLAAIVAAHAQHAGGVVVVHGGGAAVDRQLDRLGLVSQRHEGIRLTPPEHIEQIVGVLAGRVNKQLVGHLQRHGAPAVGLCLGDGHTAQTVKITGLPVDPGCVGEIAGGNPTLLRTLVGAGFIPVLSSIGLGAQGELLNVNADEAAAGLAGLLGATMVLLTDVPGVLDGSGDIIGELDESRIERAIADGTIHGGMIVKVRGALKAAGLASMPVTIASWQQSDSLSRVAAGESVGTRVLPPTSPVVVTKTTSVTV